MTKVKNRDISVDLPTSESAIKLKPDDKQAIVGLDAEGNFYWDGQPCSTNFMMEQLRRPVSLIRVGVSALIWIKTLHSDVLWK